MGFCIHESMRAVGVFLRHRAKLQAVGRSEVRVAPLAARRLASRGLDRAAEGHGRLRRGSSSGAIP